MFENTSEFRAIRGSWGRYVEVRAYKKVAFRWVPRYFSMPAVSYRWHSPTGTWYCFSWLGIGLAFGVTAHA